MCYNPHFVKVGEAYDAETGEMKKQLRFVSYADDWDYTLPCGKCAECLIQHSSEWAYRICLEAKEHKDTCFITLTYKDNPVSLVKKDYQLFLKRLRKKVGPIRYFACGEYGSKGKRPHYHMIIFGWKPDDLESTPDDRLFASKSLEELWGKGFVSVGDLSFFDAKYCAKYMQKLQNCPPELVQPFVAMSLKPGLGLPYFEKHKKELVESDKIYFNGSYIKLPRYFIKKSLQDENLLPAVLKLKELRSFKADLIPNTASNLDARKLKYKKLLDSVEK